MSSGHPAASAPSVVIGDLRFVPMIEPGELREGVARVAAELAARWAGELPLMVCVLNGAAIFHADLVRMMPFPLEVDYLRVSSYQGGIASSGTIIFTANLSTQVTGRNVIVVEDIVDTGRTAEWLRRYLLENGAGTVEVAALLYKREADRVGRRPEYVAFEIPDRFVVGYGLDYMQQGRNLSALHVLEDLPPTASQPGAAGIR
jgi:hypoxanthine phosphoribosyltransferase